MRVDSPALILKAFGNIGRLNKVKCAGSPFAEKAP